MPEQSSLSFIMQDPVAWVAFAGAIIGFLGMAISAGGGVKRWWQMDTWGERWLPFALCVVACVAGISYLVYKGKAQVAVASPVAQVTPQTKGRKQPHQPSGDESTSPRQPTNAPSPPEPKVTRGSFQFPADATQVYVFIQGNEEAKADCQTLAEAIKPEAFVASFETYRQAAKSSGKRLVITARAPTRIPGGAWVQEDITYAGLRLTSVEYWCNGFRANGVEIPIGE